MPQVLHLGGPAAVCAAPSCVDACTDDFKMYHFKVRRCTKTRAHDWTECPFTHPGEKARRRDPRRVSYAGTACPDFRKGSCRRGDGCQYAHGVFECWLHPSRYRTQSCKDGVACCRRVCFFAHRPGELREPCHPFGSRSASPTNHPLPHSPSSGSTASQPRSASPPLTPPPEDTFAELAAYGLIDTHARAPMHGRRGISLDGGRRPMAPGIAPPHYDTRALAAEEQLAHLNLAVGAAGLRQDAVTAAVLHAAAAAAVQAAHQHHQAMLGRAAQHAQFCGPMLVPQPPALPHWAYDAHQLSGASFPRASSFAHLGIVEGVLDL